MLLLHGNPTWSFLWRHAIKALVREGHRVIAPDLLGFGRSDKPNTLAAYTLDRHVARLFALWQSLDAQEVSLVVHDWGGPIGLWWLKESGALFGDWWYATRSVLYTPPTGKHVTISGNEIFRIADGRIVEQWAQFDIIGALRQFGVVPAPGQ